MPRASTYWKNPEKYRALGIRNRFRGHGNRRRIAKTEKKPKCLGKFKCERG